MPVFNAELMTQNQQMLIKNGAVTVWLITEMQIFNPLFYTLTAGTAISLQVTVGIN